MHGYCTRWHIIHISKLDSAFQVTSKRSVPSSLTKKILHSKCFGYKLKKEPIFEAAAKAAAYI